MRTSAEASLRRLDTDYIDLLQIHVPDAEVPVAETLGALGELVDEGKVLAAGCSNFSAEQLDEADEAFVDTCFVSVQNQYSLLHREPEEGVLDACARLGLGLLPYFPLHAGVLTGKYRAGEAMPEGSRLASIPADRVARFYDEATLATVAALEQFATSRGRSLLDLAFSWLLMKAEVASVIAGATKPDQVAANASASSWKLTSDELLEVDSVLSAQG